MKDLVHRKVSDAMRRLCVSFTCDRSRDDLGHEDSRASRHTRPTLGMNGVMLARKARQAKPTLRVLLSTGYADAAIERTDDMGVEFDTINKPYRQTELLRRVRILLDGPTGIN